MKKDLCELNLEALRALYEAESSGLRRALINGLSWDELKDQRKNVTELAIAIHKKIYSETGNPAEKQVRKDSETA